GVGRVETRDEVEARRLARAVRPDQPRDRIARDRERNLVAGHDAAEGAGQPTDVEQGEHGLVPTLGGSDLRSRLVEHPATVSGGRPWYIVCGHQTWIQHLCDVHNDSGQ